MKTLIKFILLILILLSSDYSFSQDSLKCDPTYFKDELLDKLVGIWKIDGQIMGDKIQNDFSAEWVLDHQFLILKFTDVSEKPDYVAHVYIGFDCISEHYVVHWIDNFGGRTSTTLGYGLKKSDTEIEFRFEYPNAPFINQFTYDSKKDAWRFYSTTKNENGEWVVFGDEYLKRIK